jgi:hypothetical protein
MRENHDREKANLVATRLLKAAIAESSYWGDEGRGAGATGAAGGVEGTGARVL